MTGAGRRSASPSGFLEASVELLDGAGPLEDECTGATLCLPDVPDEERSPTYRGLTRRQSGNSLAREHSSPG